MIRTTPRKRKNGTLSSGVTVRESADTLFECGKVRPVIVIIGPGELIGFRLKGTRRIEETTVAACYAMALRSRVTAERAAKKKGIRR